MDPHWFILSLQMYTPTEESHSKKTEQESKKDITHRWDLESMSLPIFVPF